MDCPERKGRKTGKWLMEGDMPTAFLVEKNKVLISYIDAVRSRIHDIDCDVEAGRTGHAVGASMRSGLLEAAIDHIQWSLRVANTSCEGLYRDYVREYEEEQSATARELVLTGEKPEDLG